MPGFWINDGGALDNLYKYNGKELNGDFGLGWYNYGKRWYDPALGSFPSVDPIIDEFPYLTPYNYASNSPVTNMDLWGLQGTDFFAKLGGTAVGIMHAAIADVTGLDMPRPNLGQAGNQDFEVAEMTTHAAMMVMGAGEAATGTGIASGGAAATATGVLAEVGAPAMAVGAGMALHRGFVMGNASKNLAESIKRKMEDEPQSNRGTGREKNHRVPDKDATGDHSVFNDRGNTTYKKNDKNPSGFDEIKRVDTKGGEHDDGKGTPVPTPHVHEKGKKEVRPAVKGQDY